MAGEGIKKSKSLNKYEGKALDFEQIIGRKDCQFFCHPL